MDLLDVFKPIVDFFVYYCSIILTVGGLSFSVGSLFIWCGLVALIWNFIRRLAD